MKGYMVKTMCTVANIEKQIYYKVRNLMNTNPKVMPEAVHLLHVDIRKMTHSKTKKWINKIKFETWKEKYRKHLNNICNRDHNDYSR